ncbi:selenium metabolism-associated LysR family transcriptional regulator [Neobacillus jeddahensis]|uniref:selenium metabolism-associated LysR family transcriptional regulator n=1 Tax=Neobacillus jeddahensis TaxID=1461580 RepID=UPI00058C284D|nr:selenium metabolism-associated LysR family transcriptional regulator [Neobacillus jeddahensis]
MNLKKIQAFILIIEKQSFSEAAESLGLTQPAVSSHIKSLEKELGVKLVERASSTIQLTPAGSYVYSMGRQLLEKWNELTDGVRSFQGSLNGNLRIGASTIPGTYLLPKLIGPFYEHFPKVNIINEIADSEQILARILNKQIDIGITGAKSNLDKMISELVATDSLVLISPNFHPLVASTNEGNPVDLTKYNFILREAGSGTRKSMEEGLKGFGIQIDDLRIVAQFGSTEAIIAAVEEGLGLSFVSKLAATPAVKAGRVQLISTMETFTQRYYLSYLKNRQDNPIIKEFIKMIYK